MKKLLLLASLCIFNFSFSQKFEGGIKLGYVNSRITENYMGLKPSSTPKSNVYISVPIEYKVHKNFSLQGELAMAGLGGENLQSIGGSRLHLTTIFFPLGIKIYPINQFSLNAGFNFGFTTNALGKENGQDVEFEDIKTSNHSYYFGAEYKFTRNILAEVRYNKGISNLVDSDLGKMKNNFLQIGVGYLFDRF